MGEFIRLLIDGVVFVFMVSYFLNFMNKQYWQK